MNTEKTFLVMVLLLATLVGCMYEKEDEEETADICVYSQSLMGSNWKEYLQQGLRVLRYNGEMVILDTSTRYEEVKSYLTIDLNMVVQSETYGNYGKTLSMIPCIRHAFKNVIKKSANLSSGTASPDAYENENSMNLIQD